MVSDEIIAGFISEFGAGGDIRVFFAPLRVNLIGEYTDIAGGLVLPCALDTGIWAAARKRGDGLMRLKSQNESMRVEFPASNITFDAAHGWANYPKGVVFELLKELELLAFTGADIFYSGNAGLTSAGLSSSAAIEVLTGVALAELYGFDIDGIKMSLLCQRAENDFVGVKCGIMDQFASRMGKADMAVLLDCGSLVYEYIPIRLDESGLALIIMNTNKKRGLLDSKYNERRAEADAALHDLTEGGIIAEGGCLCSISEKRFFDNSGLINQLTSRRRAKHLICENARVKRAADALKNSDFIEFGKLLNQSHISLRDDFEVTGSELDALVDAAWQFPDCLGARMTGAGFGGCAVAIVKRDGADSFILETGKKYSEQTGLNADFYACRAGEGAGKRL